MTIDTHNSMLGAPIQLTLPHMRDLSVIVKSQIDLNELNVEHIRETIHILKTLNF